MSNNLVQSFINLIRDTPFPGGEEFTEEAIGFFEYANDIVLTYRGDPSVLVEAFKVYMATGNRAYAHAGAGYVMITASYIGGKTNFDKQGLQEAGFLIENAKLFAPNRYEIEFIESTLCNAYGDVAGLETVLNNLQHFPESSTASNYAQAQMRYWNWKKDMKRIRHWYNMAIERAENEIRRIAILSHMAGILSDRSEYAEEAIQLYRQVVELNPNDPWTWHNLSLLYLDKKEYVKAGECNRRALDIMPFGNAENINKELIEIWAKTSHKDPLKEYPRYLSATSARSEGGVLNRLLGKK